MQRNGKMLELLRRYRNNWREHNGRRMLTHERCLSRNGVPTVFVKLERGSSG
jgi:hypothetical protein